jgi:hypothetical protein
VIADRDPCRLTHDAQLVSVPVVIEIVGLRRRVCGSGVL